MTRPRPVSVTVCPNGPLLVRGDIDLRDDDGTPIRSSRNTVALCRCGVSTIKPFCDGTHKFVGMGGDEPSDAA